MRKGKARTHFFIMLSVAAAFVALLAVIPAIMPFDVNATNLREALKAPGEDGFILGSDSLGRDVLARTLMGGSESVTLALAVVLVVSVTGCIVGLLAGYFSGIVDYVLSKIVTAFQAFPSFVLAVAIAGILGQGLANMVIAISAVYWTQYARLVRSIVIAFKSSECVNAAKMCGTPTPVILQKYFLPEALGPVAVLSAVSMSDIILTMAGLSFIGLGPERPTNEWGAMMAESQATFQYAIWCMLVPMAALFIAVVIFNLLGDTLRDALDVRTQHLPKRRFFKRTGKNGKPNIKTPESARRRKTEASAS